MNRKKHLRSRRRLAGALTLVIVVLLILAGPANALNLALTGFSVAEPEKGTSTSTTATIHVQANERLQFGNIELHLDGPVDRACTFSIEGIPISGCEGIDITYLGTTANLSHGFGYGYGGYGYRNGYSNGDFTYNITLNTENFIPGKYSLTLVTMLNKKQFTSEAASLEIKSAEATSTNSSAYVGGDIEDISPISGITLTMNSTGSGDIVVTSYSTNPASNKTIGIPALGKYFEIDADQAVRDGMERTKITISYTDAEVAAAGIDESTLRLYFFNDTSNSWQKIDSPDGGVDTANNNVWAYTTHFSIWGVFGNSAPVSAATTAAVNNAGGGGCLTTWKCSAWTACNNGIQTRTCTKEPAYCYAGAKPAETQTCALPIAQPQLTTPTQTPSTSADTAAPTKGFFATITGAAIGALKGAGGILVIIILAVIIIGGAVALRIRKNRKQTKAIQMYLTSLNL
jgi:hypothetical protein